MGSGPALFGLARFYCNYKQFSDKLEVRGLQILAKKGLGEDSTSAKKSLHLQVVGLRLNIAHSLHYLKCA